MACFHTEMWINCEFREFSLRGKKSQTPASYHYVATTSGLSCLMLYKATHNNYQLVERFPEESLQSVPRLHHWVTGRNPVLTALHKRIKRYTFLSNQTTRFSSLRYNHFLSCARYGQDMESHVDLFVIICGVQLLGEERDKYSPALDVPQMPSYPTTLLAESTTAMISAISVIYYETDYYIFALYRSARLKYLNNNPPPPNLRRFPLNTNYSTEWNPVHGFGEASPADIHFGGLEKLTFLWTWMHASWNSFRRKLPSPVFLWHWYFKEELEHSQDTLLKN